MELYKNFEYFLSYAAIFWWSIMIIIQLLAIYWTYFDYDESMKETHDQKENHANYPGVTILRPLKGIDCHLEQNIRSSFEQEYSPKQIILCVASADDPAVEIARKLIDEYPNMDAELLIGDDKVGINPKITNLLKGYKKARYDFLWILDSNVWVRPTTLKTSVASLIKENVGLVHHLPIGISLDSIGARMESIYLSTSHAKTYLFVNKFSPYLESIGIRIACIIGKSTLVKKSIIDCFGGLEYFGNFLAEDNIIGRRVMEKGYRTEMTNDIAKQTLGDIPIIDSAKRRIRWSRIRKSVVPFATILEPFSESLVCGLLLSIALFRLFNIDPFTTFWTHYSIWFTLELSLHYLWNHDEFNWITVLSWFLKDLLFIPLYVYSLAGNTVGWRGQDFLLQADSTAIPYVQPSLSKKYTLLLNMLKMPLNSSWVTTVVVISKLLLEICFVKNVDDTSAAGTLNENIKTTGFQEDKISFTDFCSIVSIAVSMHLQNEKNEEIQKNHRCLYLDDTSPNMYVNEVASY